MVVAMVRTARVGPFRPFAASVAQRHGRRTMRNTAHVQRFLPTERRWNRTIQAEGCSALPVLKTTTVLVKSPPRARALGAPKADAMVAAMVRFGILGRAYARASI